MDLTLSVYLQWSQKRVVLPGRFSATSDQSRVLTKMSERLVFFVRFTEKKSEERLVFRVNI